MPGRRGAEQLEGCLHLVVFVLHGAMLQDSARRQWMRGAGSSAAAPPDSRSRRLRRFHSGRRPASAPSQQLPHLRRLTAGGIAPLAPSAAHASMLLTLLANPPACTGGSCALCNHQTALQICLATSVDHRKPQHSAPRTTPLSTPQPSQPPHSAVATSSQHVRGPASSPRRPQQPQPRHLARDVVRSSLWTARGRGLEEQARPAPQGPPLQDGGERSGDLAPSWPTPAAPLPCCAAIAAGGLPGASGGAWRAATPPAAAATCRWAARQRRARLPLMLLPRTRRM